MEWRAHGACLGAAWVLLALFRRCSGAAFVLRRCCLGAACLRLLGCCLGAACVLLAYCLPAAWVLLG
eukprot:11217236-Lingulodinium_polyedra.AAC.1